MNTAMKHPKNIIENFDLYAPKLVSKEEFFVPVTAPVRGAARLWPSG